MANPLKSFINIKREELPLSLLMFSYFFLVITSFWILKPLKKTLFITFYAIDIHFHLKLSPLWTRTTLWPPRSLSESLILRDPSVAA